MANRGCFLTSVLSKKKPLATKLEGLTMNPRKFEIKITERLSILLQCVSKEQAVEVFDILTYFPNILCDYKPYSREQNQLIVQILLELEHQMNSWKE